MPHVYYSGPREREMFWRKQGVKMLEDVNGPLQGQLNNGHWKKRFEGGTVIEVNSIRNMGQVEVIKIQVPGWKGYEKISEKKERFRTIKTEQYVRVYFVAYVAQPGEDEIDSTYGYPYDGYGPDGNEAVANPYYGPDNTENFGYISHFFPVSHVDAKSIVIPRDDEFHFTLVQMDENLSALNVPIEKETVVFEKFWHNEPTVTDEVTTGVKRMVGISATNNIFSWDEMKWVYNGATIFSYLYDNIHDANEFTPEEWTAIPWAEDWTVADYNRWREGLSPRYDIIKSAINADGSLFGYIIRKFSPSIYAGTSYDSYQLVMGGNTFDIASCSGDYEWLDITCIECKIYESAAGPILLCSYYLEEGSYDGDWNEIIKYTLHYEVIAGGVRYSRSYDVTDVWERHAIHADAEDEWGYGYFELMWQEARDSKEFTVPE